MSFRGQSTKVRVAGPIAIHLYSATSPLWTWQARLDEVGLDFCGLHPKLRSYEIARQPHSRV